MNEEKDFFKTCFNIVAGLEVKNESQAIAKEVVLSEVEKLQQENKILKENAENNDKVVDKVNWENMSLKKENQQLKIQISAREEEYKKLENKLTETENWLRPAILQLMGFAKQDYYWITDQQIDNAKLVPIELSVMGDGCVKFKKLERGVSDVED